MAAAVRASTLSINPNVGARTAQGNAPYLHTASDHAIIRSIVFLLKAIVVNRIA